MNKEDLQGRGLVWTKGYAEGDKPDYWETDLTNFILSGLGPDQSKIAKNRNVTCTVRAYPKSYILATTWEISAGSIEVQVITIHERLPKACTFTKAGIINEFHVHFVKWLLDCHVRTRYSHHYSDDMDPMEEF